MRLGVYVGSFNPVHEGHIKIAKFLLNNNYVDKVLMIPTLGYWTKLVDISLYHRIKMLKFYESNKIIIDTKHNNLEYTYEILDALKKETNAELFLIIGADNLVNFHLWKNVHKIKELAKILVINRDGIDTSKYINNDIKFILVDGFKSVNISSSKIKEYILAGKYDKINKVMNNHVIKYIKDNKLYRRLKMEEKYTLIVRKLESLKKTIATMESCTGGRIAAEITNISGASDVLKFSAVTYASEYKIKMGVKEETILKYTVYSANVAREMSKQISLFAKSDIGVGVTGKMDEILNEEKRLNNNKIYVSVYDQKNDKYYEKMLIGKFAKREENKKMVASVIADMILFILNN